MKSILLPLLLSSAAMAGTQIVPAPLDHLYIPAGFDSNDSVEVVVTGSFPNSCYSRNKVEVKVKDELIDIKVTAIAPAEETLTERACAQMIVPFTEVVSVGNLQGGEYEVRVNEGAGSSLRDKISISEATSNSVDDNIYAAIEWVERKSRDEVVLHGWRYSNCIELDEVKVRTNGKDTLSVLPVMKQLSTFCPMKMMPVSYPVKLDYSSIKINQPLLHVRTMDGKSVNSIINIEDRR